MTAIVAGQGLGLINTSLGLLGEQGQLGVAGQGRSGEKVAVNAATGNLVIQQQDEWLVGVGADLIAQRTYNSLASGDDDNGDNWRLGYSRRIEVTNGGQTVTRVAEDGLRQTFTQVAANTYQCKQGSGSYDTLVWSGSTWTWTDGDSQTKEVYQVQYGSSDYLLTSITDLDGLSVTLTYDAATRLITQIKDSNNEYIKVEYDTATKKNITSLSTYTSVNAQITQAKRVTYTYDTNTPQQRLQRVVVDLTPGDAGDSQTYATEYSYDGSSNRIKTLKQGTLAQLLANQYNSLLSFDYVSVGSSMRIQKVNESVSGQTLITQFSYDTVAGTTTVTDANSNQTVLSYDVSVASVGTPKEGTLLSIKQPVVNGVDLTTRFTYDANGNVETVTDASGNQITYGYDANGNRTYERDGRGNVVERTFSSKNQLLTQTGYTVPAGTGLPSGATTSRYVYDTDANGGHLRFAISPLGNVTEYVYFTGGNGKGQLQYSRQYANTYSLGSMDKAVTPTLTNMTDWVASSAVDKTRQTLVEYAYDFRGQLSKQTAYNKTNTSGTGLTDDNLQVVTQYFYDQAGNLLKKIDSRADEALTRNTDWARNLRKDLGILDGQQNGKLAENLSTDEKNTIAQYAAYTTTYTYDGLNRITKQTDAQVDGQKGTITTVSVYDDTVRSTTVYKTGSSDTNSKLIEVATSVSTYDEAGHLLSLAYTNNKNQQAMGTTKYTYDKLNRLISVEVPATLPSGVGEKSYYLYDEASRKIGEVNAEGALIEYRYNKNGQVSRTIAYDTLVNMGDTILVGKLAGGTATLSDLGVATDGLDKNTWYVYDKAGRQVFTLSSSDSITGDGSEVLRVHEYGYDGLGRLVSDIGHLNNVSGAKFNQLKAFTGELSFDTSAKRIYMGSAYISVSTIADDRVTRYYYDADNRRIGELDAQNFYTQSEYDARGRLIARTRYATAVASVPSTGAVPTVVTADAAYTALGQDQVSKYVYNNKGQLIGQLERAPIYNSSNVYTGLGYLYTAYEYDGAGNRTKETRYETVQANTFDGTTAPTTSANDRVTTYTYDANNRLLSANTTPSGHKITYAYDAAGNLVSTTTSVHRGDGGSDDVRVRQQRFDALGRLTGELSAEGAKALEGVSGEANIQAIWDKYATKYVYNDAGRRIAMIEPNGKDGSGNQTVYYYDKVGRVTHTVNALGEVTQYQYDAFGQKTQVTKSSNRAGTPGALTGGLNSLFTAPGGSASTQTSYSYTRAGELSSVFKYGQGGAPFEAQTYYYDGLGNLLEMDTVLSGTKDLWTLYSYDKRGLRTSTEEQLHTTTTTDGGITFTETTDSLRLTQNTFDAFGRAVTDTDGQGILTETNYDTLGRVVQLKVPSGTDSATTTYTYDAFGRTLSSKDRSGLSTRYVYDDVAGEITVQTPEFGLKYTSVNSAGQTVSTTDARGNAVTYSYDKDGRLTETRVLDTNGSTVLSRTQTRYDMAGRVKEVEDSRGTITSLAYDKAGRVLSRTVDSASGGLALTTLYRYDAKGQMVWTRDANGTWTNTSYSKKGDVLTVVTDPAKIPSGTVAANEDKTGDDLSLSANLIDNPASGGALALETAYTYNAKGQTLTVTQRKSGDAAALLKTNYTYDALGRRDSETVDPGGKNLTTTYEYDKNNRVTKKTDAEQQVTRYVYDEEGRQRFMVDGNGALTQYTYDINGRLSQTYRFGALIVGGAAMSDAQIADAAAANANPSVDQVTTHIYDKMGRLKYARDALGNLTQYDYDLNGNVIKTTRYGKQASPAPTVDTAKSVGLLKTYTIALGTLADATKDQVTRNYYDAANRLTWTLQYDYDASANPTQKVFAQYYQYDAGGNLVATRRFANAVQNTPTAGTAPQIIAQGADAPSSSVCYVRQDDSNDPIVYKSYDKANRLKFVVDGEGYVTQNDYDNLGNLKSSIRFANAATFGSGFVAGNEVSVLDVGAATTGLKCWVFKAKTTDVNQDRIAAYGWDAAGRETTETVTDRAGQTLSSIKKAYDAVGHLKDVTDAYGTGQDVTTHYNYDSAGRLIEEIKANGTSAQASTRYKLDNLGQRTEIVDPRGVEAAESNSDWAQTARAELLAAGKISSGALPVKDSADYKAILKAYTTTQAFDAQGHVTQIVDPLGGTTNTDYDAFGNAIRVQDPNGNYGYFVFNQLNQSIWAIDPMGYATQTEYDALGQVSKITKYAKALQTPANVFISDTAGNKRTAEPASPNLQLDAANDATTLIEHDLLGRQTKITDAENYTESMQYDALGNKTSYTNKLGGVYTYKYDRVGNLQEETLPAKVKRYNQDTGTITSTADQDVVNKYEYDSRGNRTKATEAAGLQEQRVANYAYNALDQMISKTLQAVAVDSTGSPNRGFVADSNLTVSGSSIKKTSGVADGVNSSFKSQDGFYVAALSFTITQTDFNRYYVVGLSTNPDASQDQSSVEWAIRCVGNGIYAYHNGQPIHTADTNPSFLGNVSAGNTVGLVYDGEKIYFLLNGQVAYSMVVDINAPLYADASLISTGTQIDNVLLTPDVSILGGAAYKAAPKESYFYDPRGNLIETTLANHARNLAYYDVLNRKIADLSAEGVLTKYSYDAVGDMVSSTIYEEQLSMTSRVAGGTPPDVLHPEKSRTTYFSYDANHRLLTTTIKNIEIGDVNKTTGNYELRVADLVTAKAYDKNGNVIKETDARGGVTWRYYDAVGRMVAQVNPDRYLTVWDYGTGTAPTSQRVYGNKVPDTTVLDANSVVSTLVTQANTGSELLRQTDYTLDKLGRIKTQTVKNVKNITTLNTSGTVATRDTQLDLTTRFEYDGMGNLKKKTEASDDVLTWDYDQQGRQIGSTDATFKDFNSTDSNQTTRIEYNGLGQQVRKIEKDTGAQPQADRTTFKQYGTNGWLVSELDALNYKTTYTYDIQGQVVTKKSSRQTMDSLDPKQLLSSDTNARTDIEVFTYDLMGRQTKHVIYDVQGYFAATPTTLTAAQVLQTTQVVYDAYGEIVNKNVYGGLVAPTGWQETTMYDNAGRAIVTNAGTGIDKAYVFDANGNATLKIENAGTAAPFLGRTIDAVLAGAGTHLTASVYDGRNNLTDTYEASPAQVGAKIVIPDLITRTTYDTAKTVIQTGMPAASTTSSDAITAGALLTPGAGATSVSAGFWMRVEQYDGSPFNGETANVDDRWHLRSDVLFAQFRLPRDYSELGAGIYQIDMELTIDGLFTTPKTFYATPLPGTNILEVQFTFPQQEVRPESSNRNYSVKYSIYKTGVGDSAPILKTATSTGTTLGDYRKAFPNGGDNWAVGYDFRSYTYTDKPDLCNNIYVKGQSGDAYISTLYTRDPGGTWTSMGASGAVLDQGFVFDAAKLSVGNQTNKDFFYVTADAAGKLINIQQGTITNKTTVTPTANSTPVPNTVFLDSDGYINVVLKNGNLSTPKLLYRTEGSGGAWTTATISLTQFAAAGGLLGYSTLKNATPTTGSVAFNGWYKFKPSQLGLSVSTNYDFIVQDGAGLDIASKVAGKMFTNSNGVVSVSASLMSFNDMPQQLRFLDVPVDATRARLLYKKSSTSDAWITLDLNPSPGRGSFVWNAVELALSSNIGQSYDFQFQSFDQGGRQLTATTGGVRISAKYGDIPAELMTSNVTALSDNAKLVFDAPSTQPIGQLKVFYRPLGSTTAFSSIVATRNPGSNGSVDTYSVPLNTLSPSADCYEYYYTAYSDGGAMPLVASAYRSDITVPTATSTVRLYTTTTARPSYVVLGVTNDDQIVHRSQSYNAFGEMSSETDALNHLTKYEYNALGKLTKKTEAATKVVKENGVQQKNVTPITVYSYDKQGRMILEEDAEHNITTYTLRAAGNGNRIVAQETHLQRSGAVDDSKKWDFDAFGDMRRSTAANGAISDYQYDAKHQLTYVQRALRDDGASAGNRSYDRYTYDAKGQRIAHETSANNVVYLEYTDFTRYDGLGRVTEHRTPETNGMGYTYEWVASLGSVKANVGGWRKTTEDFSRSEVNTLIDDVDVFGRIVSHTDLGGHVFTYTYGTNGWLASQTNTVGQNIVYDYYADGKIKAISDKKALNPTLTLYKYDKQGNKVYEGYAALNGSNYFQQTTITYDELNRIVKISDPMYNLEYEYDAVGNRRHLKATCVNNSDLNQNLWYTYDNQNRFVWTMAGLFYTGTTNAVADNSTLTDGQAEIKMKKGAVLLSYTQGNRSAAMYSDGANLSYEKYAYTKDGYLLSVDTSSDNVTYTTNETRGVDLLGRLTSYKLGPSTAYKINKTYSYNQDGFMLWEKDYKNSQNTRFSVNSSSGTSTASLRSGVTGATVISTTTTTYEAWDTLQQKAINIGQGWAPGISEFSYDVNGHVRGVIDHQAPGGGRFFTYINNAQGLIVSRNEIAQGGAVLNAENFYYVDGMKVGESGTSPDVNGMSYAQALAADPAPSGRDRYKNWKPIQSANFDQNYRAISSSYPAQTSFNYTVNSDTETLTSVAKSMWGDGSLWYLIAEANGLTYDAKLVSGQTLVIPNKVTNVHNSARTSAVYDGAAALGDVSPTLPEPPPPPEAAGGCGGAGVILMVVVAVAVAAFTAGAALAALGPAMAGAATATAASVSTTAFLTAASAAGTLGSAIGAVVISGAVGAAVGSIASQAVGMATGNVDHFNWSAVGKAAVGGAVASGVMASLQAAGTAYTSALSSISAFTNIGQAQLNAVAVSVLSQQANRALGVQKGKFDWASVAAAGVASRLTQGWSNGSANSLEGFGGRFSTGLVSGGVDAAFHGHKPDWSAVAANSFGSALGDAVVGSIQQADSKRLTDAQIDKYLEGVSGSGNPQVAADNRPYLNQGQEDRIRLGATVSDVDPYGDGDGPMASSTRAVRKDGRDRLMMNGAGQWVSPGSAESLLEADGVYRVRSTSAADILLTAESASQVVRADAFGRLLEGAFSGGGTDSGISVGDLAGRFGQGLLGAVKGVTVEPVLQVRDMGAALASVTYNELLRGDGDAMWFPEMKSGLAQASANGASQGRLLLQAVPIINIAPTSYDLTTAAMNRDWGTVAEMGGGLVGGFAVVAGVKKYGGYGIAFDDVSGPMQSQMGAINPRFVKPIKVDGMPDLATNPKHIPGGDGYNRNAGTQPADYATAYEKAITANGGKSWFAASTDGTAIYRYSNGRDGTVHWSGSTADPSAPMTRAQVTPEIAKQLGFKTKGGKWK